MRLLEWVVTFILCLMICWCRGTRSDAFASGDLLGNTLRKAPEDLLVQAKNDTTLEEHDGIDSGRIFLWMAMGTKSHLVIWKPLALELANRGHQLTFVGPIPDQDLSSHQNIQYINMDFDTSAMVNSTDIFRGNHRLQTAAFMEAHVKMQERAIRTPAILHLLNSRPKFNATIISPFSIDLGLYMAKHIFGSPVILYNPGSKNPLVDMAMGNPTNPAYITLGYIFNYSQNMSFFQRVANTCMRFAWPLFFDFVSAGPLSKALAKELELEEAPDLVSTFYEADFAFFNNHVIFNGVVPANPNTAYVGGLHLRPAKQLEDETLNNWMDSASDGVVYVSFGSILRPSAIPPDVLETLTRTFAHLKPLRFLWKWDIEDMANKPDNVKLMKWLPQQDILGHPNTRLFITHGGFMSTEESIYHGVPVVVLPGFGDQYTNAAWAEREGIGKEIRWTEVDDHKLGEAIEEIVSNPKYAERASAFGAILKDQMIHPLDKAIYHVEYLMRHQGAPFLRSPAKDLYWFQYALLDVVLFLLTSLAAVLFILYKLLKCVCLRTCRRDLTKMKQS